MVKIELTEEIVAKLKAAVGDRPIYKKELFGQAFVFTHINRQEYLEIQQWIDQNGATIKPSNIEEKIIDRALLWPTISPQDWAMLPAGAIPTLAKHIQEKSYIDTSGMGDYDDFSLETLQEPETTQELPQDVKDKLKKEVKHPMRAVTIDGSTYVIRPMLRPEYSSLAKLPKEADGEVEGVKRCILWPKNIDWDSVTAGVPTVLASQIMLLSGFNDPSSVVEL